MPMSQHRLALAGILAALLGVLASATLAHADSTPTPATNPIVATAQKYLGTQQGQCWTFVQKVVLEATGQKMGFDYRQGFFDAGAIEVDAASAQAGDIIQIDNDADTAPDAD
jgi:hypothetical protein